jgi:PucR C-terminal helix-turn-helix domain
MGVAARAPGQHYVAVADLLADIVARVDTNSVARRMVEHFTSEIDAYRDLPQPVVAEQIVAISRHNLDLFFGTLAEDRPISDEELEPFRESARRRAEEGLPLEDLLHAYRLGGRMGWEALIAAATADEQAALLPSVARLMEYIDRVSDAVTDTYHDERRHLVSAEERQLHELFQALLAGAALDADQRNAAEQAGLPLVDRYRPFAIRLAEGPAHAHSQVAAALRQGGRLALTEGPGVVGIAPAAAEPPYVESAALVAVGEPARTGSLAGALDDARLLLDVAARLGASGVVTVRDYLPELLLARSPQLGTAIERRVLGPLEDYAERRSADLLETLEVFMRVGLDRRGAAEALHVHPNTLDYRRVEELAELDLSSPGDLALIALALKHRGLRWQVNGGDSQEDL